MTPLGIKFSIFVISMENKNNIRGIKPLILEKRRKKSAKHYYFDCGYFEQGLDEEDLERLLQHHLKIVSVSLNFSSIYLAYFVLVCVCMYLSMLVLIFHR